MSAAVPCVPLETPQPEQPNCVLLFGDPCSIRLPLREDSRLSRAKLSQGTSRRRFLTIAGGTLLLPLVAGGRLRAGDFVSKDVDPAKLWDGERQLVFAYKRGETMGEACQRLDAVKDELPVSIIWRLPPDWVRQYPTIHFEVSSRRWKQYPGWQDAADFVRYYEQFLPPPKSKAEGSPFKSYAAAYDGPEWTYPGEITEHLLDPEAPHRFSEYELRGLSKVEKENLHAAHHEEIIAPGRRPPVPQQALTRRD